ncbi:MAG: NUDIX domain-containing protein [Pseudomonadota bacterium]
MPSIKRIAGKLGVMRPAWWIYSSWLRFTAPIGIHVRALVCRPEDRAVLLIRHTYRSGWFFPGGGLERHETAGEGAKREAWEEAGIRTDVEPNLVGIFMRSEGGFSDHVALYRFDVWEQEEVDTMEIAEARFFTADALPPDLEAGTRRRIEEMTGQRAQETTW